MCASVSMETPADAAADAVAVANDSAAVSSAKDAKGVAADAADATDAADAADACERGCPEMTPGKLECQHDQNGVIQPLLTDLYQITMAYAYWHSNKRNDLAVFDLYFRKNPFGGEFTIFAGLEECLKYLKNFRYSAQDIAYLKRVLPHDTDPEFFDYLRHLTPKLVTVYAIDEGTVVFPKIPLLRIEGPLPVVQLLETTLLTLVNYASLVATNAARFRLAAGYDKELLEFGLRRAQGPDGGLSASRYCYIGGFNGTSNVLAGKLFDIPVKGTHAHAFVTSFSALEDLTAQEIKCADGRKLDLVECSKKWLKEICAVLSVNESETNKGELAAFISYASAFPERLLCLLDTYDVIRSGIPNFCAVALALHEAGFRADGVRLDSGDLAYLSVVTRRAFETIADKFQVAWFEKLTIVASNDINEDTIHSLNHQSTSVTGFWKQKQRVVVGPKAKGQGHSIDCFGVGTHLVTCQRQPALGCVFKLVEVNSHARIKLSEDVEKVTLPGRKNAYRLYGQDGTALVDLLTRAHEPPPEVGQRTLCRNPFQESKRAHVIPSRVDALYKCYWQHGQICQPLQTIRKLRVKCEQSLRQLRTDHKRALNPTPYKVSVTDDLYKFIHDLWLKNAPIGELS